MVEETAKLPGKTVAAVVPSRETKPIDPAALQVDLLRYADDFAGRTAFSLDEYARRSATPKARSEALNWKLALNSSVIGIATSANPVANLVDLLALSSLTRAVVERKTDNYEPREALDPWVDTSRALESNAWKIAEAVLTANQQTEIRELIARWLAQNTNGASAFLRHPQDLATGFRQNEEKKNQGSVFSLVGLDPTSGLDPAVREMTRSRLFAERALFAMQRVPFLFRWQTEVLSEQLLRQEQLTNAVASADRLSRAAESVSQTAALLPDRISSERKAVLDALDAQEGKLRDLSVEIGQTMTAAEKMSSSLNTTIISFDALMKRFGVGEPSAEPQDTNSKPFNILDYAHTAEQMGAMAQQLDALIKDASGTMEAPALDKRIAQLNSLSTKARVDAKSVLNHAFLLVAGLIILGFACAVAYRRLTPRGTTAPPNHQLTGRNL